MKPGIRINALPGPQLVKDALHLLVFVPRTLPRVHAGDVDDGLLRRVQHIENIVRIRPGIKVITDIQGLQILITVELFVISVGHALEAGLILRQQHRLGIAPEIGTGHGHHMGLVARDQLAQMRAQFVVRIGADMVKLVDGDQPLIKSLDPIAVHGKAKGRMGADQYRVGAVQERTHRIHLAAILTGRVAQIPLGPHHPICPEPGPAQGLVIKTRPDGFLRHHHDGLFQPLVMHLVQRDEHQRAALARSGWRFDQQILFATLVISPGLHDAHAQFVRLFRVAVAGVTDADRRNLLAGGPDHPQHLLTGPDQHRPLEERIIQRFRVRHIDGLVRDRPDLSQSFFRYGHGIALVLYALLVGH